jgi:hypothetical protein
VTASINSTETRTEAARRLRTTMAACRVQFTWFGTSKSLTPEQRAAAAAPFDAEGQFLSAGKKILDTRHVAFRALTAVRGRIESYWKGLSLPFPEPGVRLIPQDKVEGFASIMGDYRTELEDAARHLHEHYAELKHTAAGRLGTLFHEGDYPPSLLGLFGVSWDFPSVEPPAYLVQLSPSLYMAEQERVRARFDEAVRLAEQGFIEEFARLVDHITERLSGTGDNGSPRVFRDSAVGNLSDFFQRFKELNVRSNAQLDELVERAQRAVRGVGAQDLRDNASLRERVTRQLGQVQTALDGMIVDRPRRRILRQPATQQGVA